MLALPRPEGLSAVGVIKRWCKERIMPSGSSVRQPSAPPAISVVDRQSVARFSDRFDLLLIRMEALRLEPGEVQRLEPAVFHDLAAACSNCDQKDHCERDLAYQSAGTVTQDWEKYCPNAAFLNAMRELPWFGNQSLTRTD